MRKITGAQITCFLVLLTVIVILAILTTILTVHESITGEFYSVIWVVVLLTSFYAWAILIYRLSHIPLPLKEGALSVGSSGEFAYQVDTLFRLVLFYPLIRTYLIPTPLMRLVYQALGTRMGPNTYSGGSILDPALTTLGANTIIGHNAVLASHVIKGPTLYVKRIEVGDDVTIGGGAVIMAGVRIADGATVGIGSVVGIGTRIGPGENWAGAPARRLDD